MSEEDLVEKWSETGLLYDLSEDKKVLVSNLFESMVKHILSLDKSEYEQNDVASITLPIIYRIVNNGGDIDSVIDLYGDITNFFNIHEEEVSQLVANYDKHIDAEAELIAMYVEHYLNQNKDE
jgi:hypothetical protein